jgi:replication initiation protein RepC
MHTRTHNTDRATGLRRLSHQAKQYFDAFDRPPDLDSVGVSRGQVLATFKAAARYMKLSRSLVDAIDHLFSVSFAEDWVAGCRPIVWPSAREQGEALGLSPTRIKALNRELIDLGLILAKDSPDGSRWGRRNHNGVIVAAYGFDLSPLAHRIAEFQEIRAAGDREKEQRADLRRRKTIALRSIQQLVRTAADNGFDRQELYDLADGAYAIPGVEDRPGGTDAFARYVLALEEVREHVRALYDALADQFAKAAAHSTNASESGKNKDESDPSGSEYGPPYYNYKPTLNLTNCIGHENGSSDFGKERALTAEKPEESAKDKPALPTVRPKEVLRLAPAIARYLNHPIDQLSDAHAIRPVLRAAEICAYQRLGVSQPLWRQAEDILQPWGAVLAVMVVAAKDEEHFTRTPAHYFAGMIERAKAGQLRLDRSIWGLRSRAEKPAHT